MMVIDGQLGRSDIGSGYIQTEINTVTVV
jgi:hypothetical protein